MFLLAIRVCFFEIKFLAILKTYSAGIEVAGIIL
jgi:hypothetical protein